MLASHMEIAKGELAEALSELRAVNDQLVALEASLEEQRSTLDTRSNTEAALIDLSRGNGRYIAFFKSSGA